MPERLPKDFKQYFWDVDFKKLSLGRHCDFILSRLLKYGGVKVVRWMFKNINKRKIKDYVRRSGSRELDKRSNNFWRIYFSLPPQKKPANPLWNY